MNKNIGDIKWYWVLLGAAGFLIIYGVVKHMLVVQNVVSMPNGGTYVVPSYFRPLSGDEANKLATEEEAKLNPTPTKK